MTETQLRSRRAQETLRRAVAEDLEKKRLLGQYAVIFQNGKTVRLGPEQIPQPGRI
jgi:hypothetical protein